MKSNFLRSLSLVASLVAVSQLAALANDPTTQKFAVTGMHCMPCANAITDAVKKVEGVESVTVKFVEKEATVTYDASKTTADAIVAKIKETGYDAKAAAN